MLSVSLLANSANNKLPFYLIRETTRAVLLLRVSFILVVEVSRKDMNTNDNFIFSR